MNVKAKFECISILTTKNGKLVTLSPVINNKPENADWARFTPSGKLELYIDNQTPAVDAFTVGDEYYMILSTDQQALIVPTTAGFIATDKENYISVNRAADAGTQQSTEQ